MAVTESVRQSVRPHTSCKDEGESSTKDGEEKKEKKKKKQKKKKPRHVFIRRARTGYQRKGGVVFSPCLNCHSRLYRLYLPVSQKEKRKKKKKRDEKQKENTDHISHPALFDVVSNPSTTHSFLPSKKKPKKTPHNKKLFFFSFLVVPGTRLHVNRIETHTPV